MGLIDKLLGAKTPPPRPAPAKKAAAKKAAPKKTARPGVIVHAAPKRTAAEAARDAERYRLHQQSQREWAEAERLERVGGDIVRITLLKASALDASRRSHL